MLINQNKNLCEEITKLKDKNKVISLSDSFDCQIFNNSIKEINFILNYIKEHDKSFSFNNLNLLYRATRDSDRTEICHKLCDGKQNILIIIITDTYNIFGGYTKIGFKTNEKTEYIIDNNCFLFSINLKKIYPVKKDKKVICYTSAKLGLCFYASLGFYDHFLTKTNSLICENDCKYFFENIPLNNEINGGKKNFKCKELEVFQLK